MSDNECLMIFLTTSSDTLDEFDNSYKTYWFKGYNIYNELIHKY